MLQLSIMKGLVKTKATSFASDIKHAKDTKIWFNITSYF